MMTTDKRPRKVHYPHHMFGDQAACGRNMNNGYAPTLQVAYEWEPELVTCGQCLDVMANHPAYQAA